MISEFNDSLINKYFRNLNPLNEEREAPHCLSIIFTYSYGYYKADE